MITSLAALSPSCNRGKDGDISGRLYNKYLQKKFIPTNTVHSNTVDPLGNINSFELF